MLSRQILADFRPPPRTSLSSLVSAFKSVHLPPAPEPLQSNLRLSSTGGDGDGDGGGGGGTPKRTVRVPRQKYIPVSKAELLEAIAASMFDTREGSRQFLEVSSCLDSVLHAEHKHILEEMRAAFAAFHGKDGEAANSDAPQQEEENSVWDPPSSTFDMELQNGAFEFGDTQQRRVAIAARFQRAFMGLLRDAQFEELSPKDLMLVSSLTTDYLLTLPISVDWKKASEANAVVFRRGYTTEKQKGLLLPEKLDYIQSKLLRGIFFVISKPLAKLGSWMVETGGTHATQELKDWAVKVKQSFLGTSNFQRSNSSDELEAGSELVQELPIWAAAQRAISRYEAFLSSAGPRGRLLGKLLTWTGLAPPTNETQLDPENNNNATDPYLRPILLSRISLGDIWKPAAKRWFRSDLWGAFRTSLSILLSQSILQEAAFQELILLYIDSVSERGADVDYGVDLQVKIYKAIPIPDLPVIFPHKKLSFRIIDTVRLDVATLLGLLAYFINYKFEDILSSPSAILFDAVSVSALIIFVTRVVLGYKQTWDRYQLLVNKTLYEKTIASGFGSVHFLLDASEQQKFKEAILAYAILLRANNVQMNCRQRIGDECERFVYDAFKQKVEMPVDKAIDTLLRLGLVAETCGNGSTYLQAVPCPKAYQALKELWDTLLI